MTHTKKEREYYNIYRERACERLGITKNQYNWFRRNGEVLHKLYEDSCNGVVDEETLEINENIITKEIKGRVTEHKLHVYFQTDPRGAPIYLDTKPIPENSYNNAVCVY